MIIGTLDYMKKSDFFLNVIFKINADACMYVKAYIEQENTTPFFVMLTKHHLKFSEEGGRSSHLLFYFAFK